MGWNDVNGQWNRRQSESWRVAPDGLMARGFPATARPA